MIGRWPASITAGVRQAMGMQCRSVRLLRVAEQLSVYWHLPDCSSERQGLGLSVVSDGPVPVLRNLGAFRVCFRQAEQSQSTALLGRLERRSIKGGKSCQQEDLCLGFCRLWADWLSKGEFQCFTYLISQETSKKRENERDRDRINQSFWLAPTPSASGLVKRLKVLTHLGSYISHKAECISFMSHFWIHSHAQWAVLSASGGNGIKAELARMP